MKKILTSLVMALLLVSTGFSAETICKDPRPAVCTMDYTPVCGTLNDKSVKTYANGCGACSNANVVSYVSGECPPTILSADEVTQLFSGNTYEAVIPSRGISMTVSADPDGTSRGMQGEHKFTYNWSVSDKGELCVSYKNKLSCHMVMQENGVYKKFKLNPQGKKVVLVVYPTFTPGNIHNY